ncbi:MAG: SDR family NAD(P)-dependent oxidoreductase [Planctomycetota bacterium]|jgi:3-oxoacyl-[acyl-carrier protein] reductase
MDLELKDKVALVTGGSRGLGRAICLALAAEGAKVAINYYLNPKEDIDLADEAEDLAEQMKTTQGAETLTVPSDVSSSPDVRKMFEAIQESLGPLDILINNAGIWPRAYVKDMSQEQWQRTLQVNLTGPFLTCREAVRRWLAAGRSGRIVNVTSQAAFRGSTTGHADYAASKAGLVALTISLAREVAKHGIYVNAVAPGMMKTDMAHDALQKEQQQYLPRIPLGRIAEPAEVADVIVFLASGRASYITGATFDVSGGMLMR